MRFPDGIAAQCRAVVVDNTYAEASPIQAWRNTCAYISPPVHGANGPLRQGMLFTILSFSPSRTSPFFGLKRPMNRTQANNTASFALSKNTDLWFVPEEVRTFDECAFAEMAV